MVLLSLGCREGDSGLTLMSRPRASPMAKRRTPLWTDPLCLHRAVLGPDTRGEPWTRGALFGRPFFRTGVRHRGEQLTFIFAAGSRGRVECAGFIALARPVRRPSAHG